MDTIRIPSCAHGSERKIGCCKLKNTKILELAGLKQYFPALDFLLTLSTATLTYCLRDDLNFLEIGAPMVRCSSRLHKLKNWLKNLLI